MDINKKSRTELKAYYVKNAIPTESNFRDLIDAVLVHKDDGITKSAGIPLSIEAGTASDRPVLHFYDSFGTQAPIFVVSLLPGTTSGTTTTGRGLSVGDGTGATRARLFIEEGTGNVGIGTVDPAGFRANVAGTLNVTGTVTARSGVAVTGALTTSGSITAGGAVTAPSASVSGALGVSGTATVATLSATGNASVGGTLGVTGSTSLSSLQTTSNASVGGTLGVTGNTTLSSLQTTGNTSVGGTLGVTGSTSLSSLGTSGNTSVGGALTVTGAATLNGNATLAGLTVKGADLFLDSDSRRGTRPNNGRFALSHLAGDTLGLNWGGNYTGGTKLHGQLQVDSRVALYGNHVLLGGFGGGAGGLGYFSQARAFAGINVNGPALYGNSGGVLGTIQKPLYPSPIEGALVLPGGASSGGYVTLPSISDTFANGLSIEAWIYVTNNSSYSWTRILDLGNQTSGSGTDNIMFGQVSNTSGLFFGVYRGGTLQFNAQVANVLTTNEWMHLAVTLDASGSVKIYKNGTLQTATLTGTVMLPNAVTRTSNFIGRSNWSVDHYLAAKLAHVKLWTRALTADEIVDSASDGRVVSTTGLAGHWALDEATGTTARDRSSLARHGTLGGTAAFETYQRPALTWDASNNVSVSGKLTAQAGLVVNDPVTTTDASGVITINAPTLGPANDYAKAQFTLSGGGKVTWGGPGNRLKWTARFIAICAERNATFGTGYVDIGPSSASLSVVQDWDGAARSSTADGVVLNGWEALYAVHTIGGSNTAVSLRVVVYNQNFKAPSNWILVAVVNDEDDTVKLGTGQILAANSSLTKGGDVPSGTIVLWYGAWNTVPQGWQICDGSNGTPNLRDRFVVGAGGMYGVGATGGANEITLNTDQMPNHTHSARAGGIDDKNFTGSNLTSSGARVQFTRSDAGNDNNWNTEWVDYTGGGGAHENRPPYYALLYIMKL